jgi:hypothetical protein
MAEGRRERIQIRVSFPISKHGAYEHSFGPETTLGTILADAMTHFEVRDDSQFTYVLAHEGQEQANTTELDAVAGYSGEVRFTLVKKITQG